MQAAGDDGYVQRSDAREMRRKVAGMAGMAGVRGLTLGSYSAVLCSISAESALWCLDMQCLFVIKLLIDAAASGSKEQGAGMRKKAG